MGRSKIHKWDWGLLKYSINKFLFENKPKRFTLLSVSEEVRKEYNAVWAKNNKRPPKQRGIMGALPTAFVNCEEIKLHYRSIQSKKVHIDWRGKPIRERLRHYVRTTQEEE
tara:strand:+ start:109 stop:441 length:333 start_codon:yes stop_codon:yes gene_type:complete